jgi:hypothetical protein
MPDFFSCVYLFVTAVTDMPHSLDNSVKLVLDSTKRALRIVESVSSISLVLPHSLRLLIIEEGFVCIISLLVVWLFFYVEVCLFLCTVKKF